MKRAERDEWVAALRSGDYKQGQGLLDFDGRQCCLGVKCILDKNAGRYDIETLRTADRAIAYGIRGGHKNRYMPSLDIIKAWNVFPIFVWQSLSNMNDSGKSFAEIADWIEENVEVED